MAAGIRVGNVLGAGNATAAKRRIKVAIHLLVIIDLEYDIYHFILFMFLFK